MNSTYTEFKFPTIKANNWGNVFKNRKVPQSAIDLISKILKYNPKERPKPLKALCHPFFDDLRKQETTLPNGQKLPELFDFSEEEKGSTTVDVIKALQPQWWLEQKGFMKQLD
jgi:glycogen synthase kinase 3 beta